MNKSLYVLSVLLTFAVIAGCKPATGTVGNNTRGNQPQKPDTPPDEQKMEEMGDVLAGAGRFEELARLLANQNPTWGLKDTPSQTLASKLKAANCTPNFAQEFTQDGRLERKFSFTGASCTIAGGSVLSIDPKTHQVKAQMRFISSDDNISTLNSVSSLDLTLSGSYVKVQNTNYSRREVTLRGEGTLSGLNGKNFKIRMDIVRYRSETNANSTHQGGVIGIRLDNISGNFRYNISGDFDNLKFNVNGKTLSQAAFENYLKTLGWIGAQQVPDEKSTY